MRGVTAGTRSRATGHIIAHQVDCVSGPTNPIGEELTRRSHGNPADAGGLRCRKQSLGRFRKRPEAGRRPAGRGSRSPHRLEGSRGEAVVPTPFLSLQLAARFYWLSGRGCGSVRGALTPDVWSQTEIKMLSLSSALTPPQLHEPWNINPAARRRAALQPFFPAGNDISFYFHPKNGYF